MNIDPDPIISQERVHKLLEQALGYAEKAYTSDKPDAKHTYLANIIGTLNTLTTLYDPSEEGVAHTRMMFEEETVGEKVSQFFFGKRKK